MNNEMKTKYNEYLTNHISAVKTAFDWLLEYLPAIFEGYDADYVGSHFIKTHDRSKYSEEEYDAYCEYFYGDEKTDEVKEDFDKAWLHHQHNNPHHWQHWLLQKDEDVFSITGRGTVLTGRIETGVIHVGDPVEIIGLGDKTLTSTCTGVEMFRKLLDEGEAGDNVGLLMRGIDKKEVKRGMVVAKPGSIQPHTKFTAEVYILKKEEGGRHTPFHNKYRPQFYLRTMDVTGEISLPEGVDMVMPGDHVTITVELIYPVALNQGLRFAIREGVRTVGAGQVLDILE